MPTNDALTDESYWESVWQYTSGHISVPVLPNDPTTKWLDAVIGKSLMRTRSARFIEIGAGGSAWPAHTAAQYEAEAWGIDFSRSGLALTARAAKARSRAIHVVTGDVFDEKLLPLGYFDVVYSGGFVEHFPHPKPVMQRFAELVCEGGVVVTAVPNLCGLNGRLQRLLDRETFERHVVISPEMLDAMHREVGLVPLEPASFIGVIDLAAVNFARRAARLPKLLYRGVTFAFAKSYAVGNWAGARLHVKGGRWIAPGIAGAYRRG